MMTSQVLEIAYFLGSLINETAHRTLKVEMGQHMRTLPVFHVLLIAFWRVVLILI